MTATLTFNLDDHEDRIAHMRATKALNMYCALFEITHNLHRRVQTNEDVFDAIDQILKDNHIDIDELT